MRYTVAVLDLDNTLYDWVAVFSAVTSRLLDSLAQESGVDREVLARESRNAFAAARSLEHTFLLQDLPSLRELHPRDSSMDLVTRYAATVERAQEARRETMVPYPGVAEGLKELVAHGVRPVVLTSAPRFPAVQRLRVLGVERLVSALATAPDGPVPADVDLAAIRRKPDDHYVPRAREIDTRGLAKPDPRLLALVTAELGVDARQIVMVGDDVASDMVMSAAAGVDGVWARYGTRHAEADRQFLLQFTHWSAAEAERRYTLTPEELELSGIRHAHSFGEVVERVLST